MQSPDPEITEYYERVLTAHRRVDGNVPTGAAIFIGDSHIQGLCVCTVTHPAVNYGIGSDTTLGVLQRLPAYQALARAGIIVLAIGANDFRRRSNAEILANYRQILAGIPGRAPIVISAALPQDEACRPEWLERNAGRIQPLNRELALLAANDPRLTFVDAGPDLVDDEGNLRDDLNVGDGVHLNTAGTTIWIRHLQQGVARARESA